MTMNEYINGSRPHFRTYVTKA